jgi:hypothetical protein
MWNILELRKIHDLIWVGAGRDSILWWKVSGILAHNIQCAVGTTSYTLRGVE